MFQHRILACDKGDMAGSERIMPGHNFRKLAEGIFSVNTNWFKILGNGSGNRYQDLVHHATHN